jgi:hypothetical protein
MDFRDHSPGARKYIREELDKEEARAKLEELHPDGSPAMTSEMEADFQPEIRDKKVHSPVKRFDIEIKEGDLLITQKKWSTIVAQLFLETFNADKSLLDVADEVKKILANQGIEANIDDIQRVIDDAQSRILRLSISKTLAMAAGLGSDWDKILPREMDLIYPQKKIEFSKTVDNK